VTTNPIRQRPTQFIPGDVFDGLTVVSTEFVRGGVLVHLRNADGRIESRRLNGRLVFDVVRKSGQTRITES
jgi:hypothetical protein